MDRKEWNKFVKVFNLNVDVTVRKEVTKSDVLLALLDEGEIAFKGFRGHQFVMKIHDKFDLKLLENIIWKPIKDDLKKKREENQKKKVRKIGGQSNG